MTPERKQKLLQVLQRRQPDLTLIAERVHKPRNLAALLRNADAVGIHQVHTVAPKAGYRYSGTALGSDRWVSTQQHETFAEAAEAVRAQGMKIYAAHLSGRALDYRLVDYTAPCAILFGAEKQGVGEEAQAQADEHIIIPMMGMVSSLNVSTAAGIILVEAQQQRLAAGLYDQPRLSVEEIARCLFEWSNRKLALFCRDRGLAYPPYDGEGELIDAPGWNRRLQQGQVPRQDWSATPLL
ncbi:tRNA (guanosine(18)-2'-O)-methyltransferase TrmH [Marinobacterium arenosum]|uniref:tRNA (guanosine(18)-2'-O)-methyltransferase TrmH n=1 Tax=Marinobacterium arenosum TaxID=2862496 RepID=UPI001C96E627|nr:tRNA (guanosine(18)-2'-O)-methyltransferase TrmH [Marinobacterium arenosum]MBY4677917.1 tRNA (guanosine(18)-2'-O)-methyltransferase TrmH [Marinobacterium arenosum]